MIQLCQELKKEQEKRRALEAANAKLTNENQAMLPKAQFYDDLVERNQLTNFRETAKELQVPERKFIKFLLTKKICLPGPAGNPATLLPACAGAVQG